MVRCSASPVSIPNHGNTTICVAMAGALKKKLGLEVTSDKVEDRGRVYKLPAA